MCVSEQYSILVTKVLNRVNRDITFKLIKIAYCEKAVFVLLNKTIINSASSSSGGG